MHNSSFKIQDSNQKMLFIVGPTGSGKSSVAMSVAQEIHGEIICADSQTLRRDLDIGTAKPTLADRQRVVHHMIDVIGPYERFSVAAYKSMAELAIADCRRRGKIPIVVGGTGLYIDALFYDYSLAKEQQHHNVDLENKTVTELQDIIRSKHYPMPTNSQNPRHLIGVIRRKGSVHADHEPRVDAKIYGLHWDDQTMKKRITERIEQMFQDGFIEEASRVIQKYGQPPQKLDAIGYALMAKYLSGELEVSQVKEAIARAHWQYVRRQRSWFKRNKNIDWIVPEKEAVTEYILKDLKK